MICADQEFSKTILHWSVKGCRLVPICDLRVSYLP